MFSGDLVKPPATIAGVNFFLKFGNLFVVSSYVVGAEFYANPILFG